MKKMIATTVFVLALLFSQFADADSGIFNHTEVDQITFPANGFPFTVFANAFVTNLHRGIQAQEVSVSCYSDIFPSYSKGYTSRIFFSQKLKMFSHTHSLSVVEQSPPAEGNLTCILRVLVATVSGNDIIHEGAVSDVTLDLWTAN